MKFRAPLLIIVGAAAAIVLATAGAAVLAWRRRPDREDGRFAG